MALFGFLGEMWDAYRAWAWYRGQRVASKPKAYRPNPRIRPRLERLEDRIVPAPTTDLWVAPVSAIVQAEGAADYTVGTNWSEGHSPNAGEIALFDPSQQGGTNTPCFVPANANLPTLAGLTLADWGLANNANGAGTLQLNSNLAANSVTINPRTNNAGNPEIIINGNSSLYALQSLSWLGGSVTGSGHLELGGADTINGTSATDKPTLGVFMDIGTMSPLNQYLPGSLTFAQNSQPLVVNTNAGIAVNSESTLAFLNQAAQGQNSATAISDGDTLSHSILVYGGTVTRTNVCELFVAMGLDMYNGQVTVTNQAGGGPLHFTGTNSNGSGLETNGGQLNVNGDLKSDNQGLFLGGTTVVAQGSTLTLGVNANSTASSEEAGTFILQGTLVPHGGFTMYAGTFGTWGGMNGTVSLDAGNQFTLSGGEIDVSNVQPMKQPVAGGQLFIGGNFSAAGGKIVEYVNSADGSYAFFTVNGTANITTATSFVTGDLNMNAKNVNKDWFLFLCGVNSVGTFTFSLPPNWTAGWQLFPEGFHLIIHEP